MTVSQKQIQDWIEAALEYSGGTHVYQDIVDAIGEGRMQLWLGERGCAVTEIVVFPRKKVLHVFLGSLHSPYTRLNKLCNIKKLYYNFYKNNQDTPNMLFFIIINILS